MERMALAPGELARLDSDRLEVRAEALRLSWRLDALNAADQHDLVCRFECSVRPADPVADRRMMRETFLSRRATLGVEQIVEHFTPALRLAAATWSRKRSAEECLTDDARGALTEVLRAAATSVAFACGLELLPPWHVEIDSPSLRRQQNESALRTRHLERLRDTGELIRQFETLRQSLPDRSAGKLLEQLNPSDRGSMLQALLLADHKRADETLYAVAGPNLVRIGASESESFTTTLIAAPQTLGPLRSVQGADLGENRRLILGARGGVLLIDPANPNDARAYFDQTIRSDLGFNAAICLPQRREIWACHSDAGLVVWEMDQPDEPSRRLPQFGRLAGRRGPRHLGSIGSHGVLFADGDHCVVGFEEPRPLPAQGGAEIIAIIPQSDRSIVVHADGLMCLLNHETLGLTKIASHPGRYVTAAAMPFFDDVRILLSLDDGAIDCVGIDDTMVTRYRSPHRGMKILAAARSIVAGVSSDRQRLVLWNTWDAQSPAKELYLFTQTHHRIADIDFA
jgi:hypothetical protein